MEPTSSVGILITRHPDQCSRNCSLHELWEDCSSRLLERAVQPDRRLSLHHPTHTAPCHCKIDPNASSLCLAPCRSTKVFELQERVRPCLGDGHGLLCHCRRQILLAVGGHVSVSRDTSRGDPHGATLSFAFFLHCGVTVTVTGPRAHVTVFGEIEAVVHDLNVTQAESTVSQSTSCCTGSRLTCQYAAVS